MSVGLTLGPMPLGPFDAKTVLAYASAALDDNPIHRDPAMAAKAGFADILVPGMLIMAHIARQLDGAPQVARIRALSSRFARPVLPGQALSLSGQAVARTAAGDTILRLKVTGPDGLAIMAEAEVSLCEEAVKNHG